LLNPVKGFDEDAREYQKQAGTEPANNLAVNGMAVAVAADLPVGVNPQTAYDTCKGTYHQHKVGQAEIYAVHLLRGLVKIINAGRVLREGLKSESKKKDGGCRL